MLLFLAPIVASADDEPPQVTAEDLRELETLRRPETLMTTPHAVSVVSRDEFLKAREGLDISESLDLVPGTLAQSSRNFAQDTRVSIRGYGSRSTFGIRGIRVLVDGVPNTLPDGQSEVDSIDLGLMERVEVVRGPVSSLYGGGSGGILSFFTPKPTIEPTFSFRTTHGTNHLSRYQALATGTAAETGYVFGLVRSRFGGYRDHSRGKQTVSLGKLEHRFGTETDVQLTWNGLWSPDGQDPGGLNRDESRDHRTRAAPRNILFDAGEKLDQQKFALNMTHALGASRQVKLMGYHLNRDFSNQLPFEDGGQVKFDRNAGGGALVYSDVFQRVRWFTGLDVDYQRDPRRRYENLDGQRGALTLKQTETVWAAGPFAEARYDFDWGLGVVAGARYDWVDFDANDRFKSDGNQSDDIRFRHFSPRVGVSYAPRPETFLFANYSTGFEVPTTIELRPPGAIGGFDSDREPQKSVGVEVGAKGVLFDRFFYDLALFQIHIRDTIIPFEDEFGESFFRNAAKSRRRGVEAALSGELAPGLSFRGGYTYTDYEYRDYDTDLGGVPVSYDDNDEPNNARHVFGGELRIDNPSGLFCILSLRYTSKLYTDDANSAQTGAATQTDARFGYNWDREGTLIRPFIGVRNLTGREYSGTIRPNAGFGRYYEPAPKAEVYGGINVEFALPPIN